MKVINYILKRKNKFLMQLRDNKSDIRCPGEWCFPGGGAEEKENYIDACIREVKEETNIKVKEIEYLCDHTYSWGQHSRVFIVKGKGKVSSNEGTMEWKTFKELSEMKLADNQNIILDMLYEKENRN